MVKMKRLPKFEIDQLMYSQHMRVFELSRAPCEEYACEVPEEAESAEKFYQGGFQPPGMVLLW